VFCVWILSGFLIETCVERKEICSDNCLESGDRVHDHEIAVQAGIMAASSMELKESTARDQTCDLVM